MLTGDRPVLLLPFDTHTHVFQPIMLSPTLPCPAGPCRAVSFHVNRFAGKQLPLLPTPCHGMLSLIEMTSKRLRQPPPSPRPVARQHPTTSPQTPPGPPDCLQDTSPMLRSSCTSWKRVLEINQGRTNNLGGYRRRRTTFVEGTSRPKSSSCNRFSGAESCRRARGLKRTVG